MKPHSSYVVAPLAGALLLAAQLLCSQCAIAEPNRSSANAHQVAGKMPAVPGSASKSALHGKMPAGRESASKSALHGKMSAVPGSASKSALHGKMPAGRESASKSALHGKMPAGRESANKDGSDSTTLSQSMESLRSHIPKGRKMAEIDGFSIEDAYGKQYSMAQLDECADKLPITPKSDALVLLRYLDDRDAKIRYLAASALERRLKAYPDGMILNDIVKSQSTGHKKMVALFASRIDKMYPSASGH